MPIQDEIDELQAKLGVEIAIAAVGGNTEKAATLGKRYITQLEEMAKGG